MISIKLRSEMRWKRWMRWKKNNSPHFTAFLTKIHCEIHRFSNKNSPHWRSNVYSISFKFTRNGKARDIWSRISSWSHAGGQRCEPVLGRFFSVRILRTRWKSIMHSPQKDFRNAQKLFFNRIPSHFLQKFTANQIHRPGYIFI